jgi:hypothetical protein
MCMESDPIEYPFRGADEENGYRLFPSVLETDTHTFFHGTAEENLASILANGFRSTELPSVSFAKSSSLGLKYACEARRGPSARGVVIAVRFDSLSTPGIAGESFGVHVYDPGLQPHVVGYCFVPCDYRFV